MTVKQLIEALKKLPEDSTVMVAHDEEGNHFSPLDEVEKGDWDVLDEECRWNHPTDVAVVLWPTD